jgi:hypothetical protein
MMDRTQKISDQIAKEIAQLCACSGDQPAEFIHKLHELVLNWYWTGIDFGIKTERQIRSITNESGKSE